MVVVALYSCIKRRLIESVRLLIFRDKPIIEITFIFPNIQILINRQGCYNFV